MHTVLRSIGSTIGWVLGVILAILLAIMTLLVAYQVLARYVPGIPPLLWTEEISRGLLIWLVMLGAIVGATEGTHFRLSLFSQKVQCKLSKLVAALSLVAGIYLLFSGWKLADAGLSRTSLVTGLPAIWIYASLALAGLGISIVYLMQFFTPNVVATTGQKGPNI